MGLLHLVQFQSERERKESVFSRSNFAKQSKERKKIRLESVYKKIRSILRCYFFTNRFMNKKKIFGYVYVQIEKMKKIISF